MYLLWHLFMPLTSHALGYFPARALGLGENLPRGVALEWAHWGKHPDYLWGRLGESERRGYGRFTGDIRAYSFSDDGYAPQSAVAAFVGFYPRARTSRRHLRPTDLASPRIGHFGFFRESVAGDLWPETIDWLVRGQVLAYQSHPVR
jgi:predicted alpha/beta hydrolase